MRYLEQKDPVELSENQIFYSSQTDVHKKRFPWNLKIK